MSEPFRPSPPVVLGILGGVGSGKSTLSALLAEQGLLILDADQEAARVLALEEMRPILCDLFGPGVLGPDGPRKAAIADAIFSDPSLRGRLEKAMHPRIRSLLLAEMEKGLQKGHSVVLDVPLLLEGGFLDRCDQILFLEVPDPIREARAQARGMSAEDWRRREAVQASLAEKRKHADHFFDNSGTVGDLRAQVEDWWQTEFGLSRG